MTNKAGWELFWTAVYLLATPYLLGRIVLLDTDLVFRGILLLLVGSTMGEGIRRHLERFLFLYRWHYITGANRP